MKVEFKFILELNDTDAALVIDQMNEDSIELNEFAKNLVSRSLEQMASDRKADVGRILAMTGKIDEQVRIESAKLSETRKSPW